MEASENTYPIYDILEQIKEQLQSHCFLIVQAEPGAGKSTILPLELLNEPWLNGKKIIMLEPRRLAARNVAERMSQILNSKVGEIVGYRIRHEQKVSSYTKIEVVTEGILIRMLQSDPSLEEYGLIIFDEFHERSLFTDISLVFARQALEILRPELKILIMSATMDTASISANLDNAPVLISKGRNFPIDILYRKPDVSKKHHETMAETILWGLTHFQGDILAFLPGTGEIHQTAAILNEKTLGVDVLELYGDLTPIQQQAIILPNMKGKRKVILSTSIAQTSITIQGIQIVIDLGFSRRQKFDQSIGMNKLITERCSEEDAIQRAGRAGRLGPGTAIRLWGALENQYLKRQNAPEILESDITRGVLETLNWGVNDIFSLKWITPPPQSSVEYALKLLNDLEAISNDQITDFGKQMLHLPTHPRLAHMLLKAEEIQMLSTGILLTSILEEKDFLDGVGVDIHIRMDVVLGQLHDSHFKKNVVSNIHKHIRAWNKFFNIKDVQEPVRIESAGELLSMAYPERIALNQGNGNFRLANGKMADLESSDNLSNEKWIVAAIVTFSNRKGKIRLAASISQEVVLRLSTFDYELGWNFQTQSMISAEVQKVKNLVVSSKNIKSSNSAKINEILYEVIRKNGIEILDWTEEAREFQNRISCLRLWGEINLPDVSDAAIIETAPIWLDRFSMDIQKLGDFKKISAMEVIRMQFTWQQIQEINQLAPASIRVPSGSDINLRYFSNGEIPVLAVRLQELFGMLKTPRIFRDRKTVVIHLLSPGYKPVQVTTDLTSFWTNTYNDVKKELMRRYPRHSWPDNPLLAEPMKGPKKRK